MKEQRQEHMQGDLGGGRIAPGGFGPAAAGIAAGVGSAVGGLVLVMQPGLSYAAQAVIESRVGHGAAGWAMQMTLAVLATGVGAFGVALLAGLVQCARRHPFVVLAPLLCGLSAAVLGALPLEFSLGRLGTFDFAAASLVVALGGAALFQAKGTVAKAAGALVWLLPMVLLVGGAYGYGASPAELVAPAERPLVALLVFSWFVLGVIACVTLEVAPRPRPSMASVIPGAVDPRALIAAHNIIAGLEMELAQAQQRASRMAELEENLRLAQNELRLIGPARPPMTLAASRTRGHCDGCGRLLEDDG